jgi:hypothetical protein|tara:strand:- start:743 stop:1264 length:522 start_codon:yes stop_codon:yes gene_type:complete
MALSARLTNDCKTIIIGVSATTASVGKIIVTNGSYSYEIIVNSVGTTASVTIPTSLVGVQNGVFYIEYFENEASMFQTGAIGNCDVLCCLSKKVDKLLDCSADCSKCASELAEAQQIFLLMKSAETELSSMTGGGNAGGRPGGAISSVAIIANAAKKYNKAVEICGGHCGCNC